MKKRKPAQTETLAESAVAQPPPIVHILDVASLDALCGLPLDLNDRCTFPELHARANCPECLARLVLP